jgi:hypothetical protein
MVRLVAVVVCLGVVACGGPKDAPADAPATDVDAPPDGGPCVPETDDELCTAAAMCGVVTTSDRCGVPRSVVCETCTDCAQSLSARLTTACVALPGASVTGQLECIAGAARSLMPAALVSACEAMPGVSTTGKLDCIRGGGPSPMPAALVTACTTTLAGASVTGQLECIAEGSPSTVPAALVTACEAMVGVSVTGKLDCVRGAAPSRDPDCLIDRCVASFGAVSGQLLCIDNNTGS